MSLDGPSHSQIIASAVEAASEAVSEKLDGISAKIEDAAIIVRDALGDNARLLPANSHEWAVLRHEHTNGVYIEVAPLAGWRIEDAGYGAGVPIVANARLPDEALVGFLNADQTRFTPITGAWDFLIDAEGAIDWPLWLFLERCGAAGPDDSAVTQPKAPKRESVLRWPEDAAAIRAEEKRFADRAQKNAWLETDAEADGI